MYIDIPWIDYLEIDEETCESYLNPDAPEEIKMAYKKHQEELLKNADKYGRVPK